MPAEGPEGCTDSSEALVSDAGPAEGQAAGADISEALVRVSSGPSRFRIG